MQFYLRNIKVSRYLVVLVLTMRTINQLYLTSPGSWYIVVLVLIIAAIGVLASLEHRAWIESSIVRQMRDIHQVSRENAV